MAQKTGCLFLICLQTNKLFIPYMFTNKQVVYSLYVYKQTGCLFLKCLQTNKFDFTFT